MEIIQESQKELSSKYVGEIQEMDHWHAVVKFEPQKFMVVDEEKLIHAGFIFGSASYTAKISLNSNENILSSSLSTFIAPVEYGDTVVFEAKVKHKESKKTVVKVIGKTVGIKVFEGDFVIIKNS